MRSFALACALVVALARLARGDASVGTAPAADAPLQQPDLLLQRARECLRRADGIDGPGQADALRREAIGILLELVDHPGWSGYPRMDEALFTLADVLTRVNRDEDARRFFLRLIKDHPKSRYIPHAFLSFGEHYFSTGDLEAALKLYERVLRYPESSVADYARYKSAWCYVNRGQNQEALEAFVLVAQRSKNPQLQREARRDTVRVYALLGRRDRARDFFARIAPPDEVEGLLARLDELLRDHDSMR